MVNTTGLEEYHEALTASELRYRRLFESAKDGILILDADTGYIEDVNPYLIELLGYSHNFIFDKAIWDIGFLKDVFANMENFQQLKEKKYIRYENLPLETIDGRRIDVEFVSNVYSEGSRKVIQCNIRNITDRIHTADILAAERQLLTVTLRSISESIITTDVNGCIVLMNVAAEKLTGRTQGDVQGSPVLSVVTIVDEKTRIPIELPLKQLLRTGVTLESSKPAILIGENNSELPITYSIAPIIDDNKQTIGAVIVFRNFTEKQMDHHIANIIQKTESSQRRIKSHYDSPHHETNKKE